LTARERGGPLRALIFASFDAERELLLCGGRGDDARKMQREANARCSEEEVGNFSSILARVLF